MAAQLTLGALQKALKDHAGQDLTLMACLGNHRTVFLSGHAVEASRENYLLREVAADDANSEVDDWLTCLADMFRDFPFAKGLRVWVEVDNVCYPVARDHLGFGKGLALFLLDHGTGVRP